MSENKQSDGNAEGILEELRRRLGDMPVNELTIEQQEELLKATRGMYRPTNSELTSKKQSK